MTSINIPPKVLAFDVFGTVVDWYGSIKQEIEKTLPTVDADAFTLAWRDGYAPAMAVVNASNDWVLLDVLHRQILDEVLVQFNLQDVDEKTRRSLCKAWHKLAAWPDSVEAIERLRQRFTVVSLSNGNLSLLTNMAKNAGIRWDCVLSAEVFKRYKPHPDTYCGVARVFDVPVSAVMMVAAHQNDLDAARGFGLQTAFIERPDEYGPIRGNVIERRDENDWHATDIADLADQLGC